MEKLTKKGRLHSFCSINQQPARTRGRGQKNTKCCIHTLRMPPKRSRRLSSSNFVLFLQQRSFTIDTQHQIGPLLLQSDLLHITMVTIHSGNGISRSCFEYCKWGVGCYFVAAMLPHCKTGTCNQIKTQIRTTEWIVSLAFGRNCFYLLP